MILRYVEKKAGIEHMMKRMKEKCDDSSTIFICHANVDEEAEKIKVKVLDEYPNSNVIVNCVGPILGNNTGPGTLALIFHGNER